MLHYYQASYWVFLCLFLFLIIILSIVYFIHHDNMMCCHLKRAAKKTTDFFQFISSYKAQCLLARLKTETFEKDEGIELFLIERNISFSFFFFSQRHFPTFFTQNMSCKFVSVFFFIHFNVWLFLSTCSEVTYGWQKKSMGSMTLIELFIIVF